VHAQNVTQNVTQNLFELFSSDPVEVNMKALKAKLAVALVAMIRAKQWNQATASERLRVTQPRISNLFRGKLEKFSVDALLEMFVRVGYKVEADLDPNKEDLPFSLAVKKAML
jgi:predicted XRE-type DNA-binding protein